METTGYGSAEAVESVFQILDLALLDIKSMNDETHKAVTGVTTELIHRNAVRIAQLADVVIRVPTIPTVNDTEEDFMRICGFVKTLRGVDTINILPYHSYGENKYELLNTEYRMGSTIKPMAAEDAVRLQKVVESQGLRCSIGG